MLITALFPYPLMDYMKIWDGTRILVFVGPKKPIVDLTVTSNSELFSLDTNDEKDQNHQLSTIDDEKYD